jgi:UDPglucose 6-dehydrogenase
MRDAPSIALIQALQDAGAAIRAYDPEGLEQARPLLPGVELLENPYSVADGADALVIVTEWDEFRALDLRRIAAIMRAPILVDLRNVYPPEEAERAGLAYSSIGRQQHPS